MKLFIKSNDGIERFALFAIKAFDDSGFSSHQQFQQILIRHRFACYLSKNRKYAGRVVATHYFAKELHGSRLAFRTKTFRFFVGKQFVTRQQL